MIPCPPSDEEGLLLRACDVKLAQLYKRSDRALEEEIAAPVHFSHIQPLQWKQAATHSACDPWDASPSAGGSLGVYWELSWILWGSFGSSCVPASHQ